ncbi:MAG: hypothetical protein U0Q12_15910 [Vicinamibacterales bacterium]
MRRALWLCVLTASVGLAGCAQPPTAEISAVDAAIQQAEAAGATDYAAEAIRAARDAKAQLDAELKAQEGKFGLMRSYTEASKLAAAAKQAGEQAAKAAAAGKEQAKAAATSAIAAAQTALQSASDLLDKAPRGKGTAQDIEAMKSDLAGVQTTLTDADAALKAEKYKEAATKAEAAKTAADAVRMSVEQAVAAKAGAKKGR